MIRRALVAVASAAGVLALCAPASATPVGPCEEVTYVGVCVPVGGEQGPAVQQPRSESAITPDSSSNADAIVQIAGST